MKLHKIKPQNAFTKEKARIIARLMGDGTIWHSGTNYGICCESSDEELVNAFSRDVEKVYGLTGNRWPGRSGKTGKPLPKVTIRSKSMYEDLIRYGPYRSNNWAVPAEIWRQNKSVKKEFLKTFFDDEGTVIIKEKLVRLYSTNLTGLKEIQKLLLQFRVKSKLVLGFGARRNVGALVIKENLKPFAKQIGFNLSRKEDKLKAILYSAKDGMSV